MRRDQRDDLVREATQAGADLQRKLDTVAHDMVLKQRDDLRAEVERLKAVVEAYEQDNNKNLQTIVDLRARLGEPSTWFKTTAELQLRELCEAANEYVLRGDRDTYNRFVAVLAKVTP